MGWNSTLRKKPDEKASTDEEQDGKKVEVDQSDEKTRSEGDGQAVELRSEDDRS
jgi:hypothetical protein